MGPRHVPPPHLALAVDDSRELPSGGTEGWPVAGCRRPLNLLASRASSLGRLRPPPIPRDGGCARRPACGGVDSRGGGALRFGARYGSSDSLPPATRHRPPLSPALPMRRQARATPLGAPRGGGRGRGHPPWTRIFCALPKRKTRISWPLKSAQAGSESAWSAGDAPAPTRRTAGTRASGKLRSWGPRSRAGRSCRGGRGTCR